MKVLVNEMPKKKEECLFYKRERCPSHIIWEGCSIAGKPCSFKNEDSICGGECRCLKVMK